MASNIAYMMSRFPKLTETFILYEMIELQRLGAQIEVFPLIKHNDPVIHPEAQEFVDNAHYANLKDFGVWRSQAAWLLRAPLTYIMTWFAVLWGNKSSLKFLLRAIPAMLLGAHFALQMEKLGVDHIHAHWATHATLGAFVIHRLTGIPYSFTGHAHDIYVKTVMLDQKIKESAFMVTISDFNRELLKSRYGADLGRKIHIVHCGVDTAVFDPATDETTNDTLDLIAVGRLEEKKGHAFLIDACKILVDREIPIACTIIGDGPLMPELQAKIDALGLSHAVTLAGRKTRSEVQQALAAANVMVMPSIKLSSGKQEGIPVALMEGLAMQKAAVATRISGIPELILDGETGLLVPERDPAAMADAVQRLYEDSDLRKQLGINGRKHVLENFDLLLNAQELHTLITQAISSKSPSINSSVVAAPIAKGQPE